MIPGTENADALRGGAWHYGFHMAPHIPFGGAKNSGLGVEFGEEGLAEFTQLQVINQAR